MEEKVYEYLNRLVSVPGISDTDEERKTAEAIREILAELPEILHTLDRRPILKESYQI